MSISILCEFYAGVVNQYNCELYILTLCSVNARFRGKFTLGSIVFRVRHPNVETKTLNK